MILTPDADCLIPTTAHKVMTKWAPTNVPDWSFMAFVYYQTSPNFQRPQANAFIR